MRSDHFSFRGHLGPASSPRALESTSVRQGAPAPALAPREDPHSPRASGATARSWRGSRSLRPTSPALTSRFWSHSALLGPALAPESTSHFREHASPPRPRASGSATLASQRALGSASPLRGYWRSPRAVGATALTSRSREHLGSPRPRATTSAHRPGRCANHIVLVMVPAQWNPEGRVDVVGAVHPDLVDQGLEQGLHLSR